MNRLANATSPYLLQHKNNPVDWYPWGEEAFRRAHDENKLIFLSIGYSTCHWCHVMERESFENAAIAELLNARFVNIKVDREERPDIDRVYMAFVQATTGGGGWPMSVWLTPELQPVVGGTYFPPDDRHGRLGFPAVIERIAAAWEGDRDRLRRQGTEIVKALQDASRQRSETGCAAERDWEAAAERAAAHLLGSYDAEYGGLGGAPKFPRTTPFHLLLRHAKNGGSASAPADRCRTATLDSLRKIAAGGIHDHLGGGFHRYSVDERWHVPHFEKMVYDQAQLAALYTEAWLASRDEAFRDTATRILDYVRRDLTAPEGGFYSAEDADSLPHADAAEKREGAFYAWSAGEVQAALGEDARLFSDAYGVSRDGNVPPSSDPHGELDGLNVLYRRLDDTALARLHDISAEEARARLATSARKMVERRASRPRPHLDDKIVAAWNGLAISAFAKAGAAFGRKSDLSVGTRAVGFLRERLWDESSGDLQRSWRAGRVSGCGYAEDFAFVIQGLLDLYEATGHAAHVGWAVQLQNRMDALFWDDADGGYFGSATSARDVLVRMKEDYDGAEPAAGSVAALNLLRLGHLLDDATRIRRARETLESLSDRIRAAPSALPLALCAAGWFLHAPLELVLAGSPFGSAHERAVQQAWLPRRVTIHADPSELSALPADATRRAFLESLSTGSGRPTVYLCKGGVCELPLENIDTLHTRLAE